MLGGPRVPWIMDVVAIQMCRVGGARANGEDVRLGLGCLPMRLFCLSRKAERGRE